MSPARMGVTIRMGTSGLLGVALSPMRKPGIKRPGRRSARRAGALAYSNRTRRRFRQALLTTDFSANVPIAITLPFPEGTAPRRAKALFHKFGKWLQRYESAAFGLYCVEFKSSDEIHYHGIVGSAGGALDSEFARELRVNWRRISEVGADATVYAEPVADLQRYLAYISKDDPQRTVPSLYHGEMTRFWGVFGVLPKTSALTLSLPEEAQPAVRQVLSDIIAAEGRPRSEAMSAAVRSSTQNMFVWIKADQKDKLLEGLQSLGASLESSNDSKVGGN